jgi:hypothetical protein
MLCGTILLSFQRCLLSPSGRQLSSYSLSWAPETSASVLTSLLLLILYQLGVTACLHTQYPRICVLCWNALVVVVCNSEWKWFTNVSFNRVFSRCWYCNSHVLSVVIFTWNWLLGSRVSFAWQLWQQWELKCLVSDAEVNTHMKIFLAQECGNQGGIGSRN